MKEGEGEGEEERIRVVKRGESRGREKREKRSIRIVGTVYISFLDRVKFLLFKKLN